MGGIVSRTFVATAQPLLPTSLVLRRMLALAGFVAVVTLALMLLYRVYVHHTNAEPYVEDDRIVVSSDVKIASAIA